jgi:hypothetical protein
MFQFVIYVDWRATSCTLAIGGVDMEANSIAELTKATKALLLVQLQATAKPEEREKPEVVLARAGYVPREIAALLNKGQHAVAKAIQRGGRVA